MRSELSSSLNRLDEGMFLWVVEFEDGDIYQDYKYQKAYELFIDYGVRFYAKTKNLFAKKYLVASKI